MANTFELISSVTVSTAQAAIDFTSISSTYTDLILKVSARNTNAQNSIELRVKLNNVTTNLSARDIEGAGSGTPGSVTNTYVPSVISAGNDTANTFGSVEIYIPNYAGSTYKTTQALLTLI